MSKEKEISEMRSLFLANKLKRNGLFTFHNALFTKSQNDVLLHPRNLLA